MSRRIGIDIGGTFTDFTVVDSEVGVTLWKEATTPDAPERGVELGMTALADVLGLSVGELLAGADLLVHGSTIATNIVITRTGARVGLLATEGFRDIEYFRDGYKPDRFNIHLARPVPIVDRYMRLGVRERVNYAGKVLVPLNEDHARSAIRQLRDQGAESIAIALLWSIMNPEHELRLAELVAEEMPGVPVLCSSDVLPEIREWERTSATVLGAYVLPRISQYLLRLEQTFHDNGLPHPMLVTQVNGGCTSVEDIVRRPVSMVGSGPAAAPSAALYYCADAGLRNVITMDMGGTTLDLTLVRDGQPTLSRLMSVEQIPIGVAGVEVQSIGAGGGSIGWVDDGGVLRVGPRSAGAQPGPACYGAGGTEPTVTDANVVLGYLAPEAFLGGRRQLRADLSEQAIRGVAEQLGLDAIQAAAGVISVVDANMAAAIRVISVERGLDPRSFVLVSAGGAGGLHAARIARQLGMRQVVVPREASTFCSFGMTLTDVRQDYTVPRHAYSDHIETSELDQLYKELTEQGRARLQASGIAADSIVFERRVDARYPNQIHEMTVPVPDVQTFTDTDVRALETNFHDAHREQYTYAMPELPIEFLHWRLTAVGQMASPARVANVNLAEDPDEAGRSAQIGERLAYSFELQRTVNTPVYSADDLLPGAVIHGPGILQSSMTTIVLGPDDTLRAQANGSLVIDV